MFRKISIINKWEWFKEFIERLNNVNALYGFPSIDISFIEWLLTPCIKEDFERWVMNKDRDGYMCRRLSHFISNQTLGIMIEMCEDRLDYLSREKRELYYIGIRGTLSTNVIKQRLNNINKGLK